jgi:carbon-monoxide dehydrogenase medium subunit
MENTEYLKPKDLKALLTVMKKQKGRALIIAGGTNLIPQIRKGEKSAELIIDISDMGDLSYIKEENGNVAIGAATTIAELASNSMISTHCPILTSAAKQLGNPLTRNRATIGGNLANASPCADTAPPLLALDASVHIASPKGNIREVPLCKFFHGYKFTDIGKGEVITQISFPKPKETARGSHTKLGLRNAASICVASVAVMIDMTGKKCQKARIAVGSVAPVPMRAYRVEQILEGQEIDAKRVEQCASTIKEEISPISDIRSSAEYRTYVTSTMLKNNILGALA